MVQDFVHPQYDGHSFRSLLTIPNPKSRNRKFDQGTHQMAGERSAPTDQKANGNLRQLFVLFSEVGTKSWNKLAHLWMHTSEKGQLAATSRSRSSKKRLTKRRVESKCSWHVQLATSLCQVPFASCNDKAQGSMLGLQVLLHEASAKSQNALAATSRTKRTS